MQSRAVWVALAAALAMAWLAWVWLWRDSVVSTPVPKLAVLSGKVLTDKASIPAAAQEPPAAAEPPVALAGKVQSPSASPIGVQLFDKATLLAAAQPTHWDLCGVGRVPAPQQPPSPPLSAASQAERAMLAKVVAVMGGPPVLPAHWGEEAVDRVFGRVLNLLPQRGPRERALALMLRSNNPALDLLQEAEAGTEAVVARWAVASCERVGAPPCRAQAARAWVKSDRSNAAAWLALLIAEPQSEQQVQQALASTTRFDLYEQWITAELVAAVPADEPEYLRMALAIRGTGIDAALPIHLVQPLLARCGAPAATAALPAWCPAVAELMVTHGDSPFARAQGTRMAERLGWPAARVKALRNEVHRFQMAQEDVFRDTEQFYTCDQIRPTLKAMLAVPELGSYRAWLQHPMVAERMRAAASSAAR